MIINIKLELIICYIWNIIVLFIEKFCVKKLENVSRWVLGIFINNEI